MKQNLRRHGAVLIISLGLACGVKAADFSAYTNEEMTQMRTQAREMPPQEHEALRSEMQSRQRSMSTEQQSRVREQNRSSGQGQGNRYGQGGGGRGR